MKSVTTNGRHLATMLLVAGFASALASIPVAKAALGVTSGDFGNTASGSTNIVNWHDVNTVEGASDWWTTAAEPGSKSPFGSTCVVLGDGNGSIGGAKGVGGRWIYQAIGTKGTSANYTIELDYGQPTDGNTSRAVGVMIEIYQGSFTNAADDVDLSGLPLIYSISTPTTSLAGAGVYAQYTNTLDLSAANTSDPLWLRISNVPGSGSDNGSWCAVDNVQLYDVSPPFHPITVAPTGNNVLNPVLLNAVVEEWGSTFDSASFFLDGLNLGAGTSTEQSAGIHSIDATASTNLAPNTVHTGMVVVAGTSPVASVTNVWVFTMADPLQFVSGSPEGDAPSASGITAVISDLISQLDPSSIELYLDGNAVVPDAINKVSGTTTISYSTSFADDTTHTGMVVYAAMNPAAGPFTNSWVFTKVYAPPFGIINNGNTAPIPGIYDIYQFDESASDPENLDGGNDVATYVAQNKNSNQGQLFTTGSAATNYTLTSVWVKQASYDTYYNLETTNSDHMTLRIVDPSQENAAGFIVHSEELTNVVGNIIGHGLGGNWIEFRLQTPVALSGDTQYGFDLTVPNDGQVAFFEIAGVTNNPYSGGLAYTTTPRGTLNTGTEYATGDRTFLVALTGPAVGPTVTPNIQSIVVSGGSATLVWDSESGINYGILSKSGLAGGSWVEVTNVAGTGASTMATVPAVSDQEFFKIEGN